MNKSSFVKPIALFVFLFTVAIAATYGQEINYSDTLNIPQVVVTANRDARSLEDVPGRVTVIDAKTIEELPVQNVDEILKSVANVYVNRSWGIFSQNSSVTMRGLDASARVLVLLDGVPLNKSAGGSVNWHLIPVNNINKIEVIKGPASTIYGNNAMAGVINIITKNPAKKFQGEASLLGGSYTSFGGNLDLSGTNVKNDKGFLWSMNSFYRRGDGYYLASEDTRDSISAKAFLREFNVGGKLGYQINANQKVDLDVHFYDDQRGQGRKVYEDLGDYMSVNTTYLRASYQGAFDKTVVNALAFYQLENEFKQTESVSANSGKYKLSERDSRKDDIGLWLSATTRLSDRQILTYGIDLKRGTANVVDTYRTSTDVLTYEGILDFYGIFLQDEYKFAQNKLELVVGARMDFATYSRGKLIVENPTTNTGFVDPFDQIFDENRWSSFSPKIALNFKLSESHSVYVSWSKGFMPPKLDDLSKSGKINKGFKLANPELGPEYLTNYEAGVTLKFFNKLTIEPSVYYSVGKDFQYFVGTGDSIDTGSGDLKPIYQRRNISNVEVLGAEISTTFLLLKNLVFNANYSFNNSTITKFNRPADYDKDLTGKYLIEVPKHMVYLSLGWKNKYFNSLLSYNYLSSQWYDDENTTSIDPYHTIDWQIAKSFAKRYQVSLTVQNILDTEYIDRKGYLNPGRFITLEIKYKF
ncbi:MAG: TonB-dependent receptor [Bacteroidales bacterium]|nr:TonB-dependent receptor [Bacteroidales bacterium]